jgi:hemolysin activation/secretion protein
MYSSLPRPVKLAFSAGLASSVILAVGLPGFAQVQPGGEVTPQVNPGLVAPSSSDQLPDVPRKEAGKLPPPERKPEEPLQAAPEQNPPLVELEKSDFRVEHIRVEGNTVLPEAELRSIVAPYENRTVTLDDLGKLVGAINKRYYEKGYFTSQAYIPPQDVDQNALTIKIMEGRVGKISVSGNRFLKAGVVLRDVQYRENDILNVQELQDRLRRISGGSGVYKLRGVLTPGRETGQTDIELQVRERYPLQISPTFDNQGRPFIGTYRWGTEINHFNLTGHGDHLRANWSGAAGTQVASGSYFVPVNRYGTQLGTTFSLSRVDVDLGIGRQPDIIGKAYDYAAVVVQPLDRNRRLTVDGSLNFRRIVTYFDGDRDSAGQTNIAALRFGLTYDRNDRFGRSFLRAQTSVAPGWMGANSKFWKNDFIATRIVTLPKRNLLILRGQAQLTPDALPSAELMQIGGAYSVRGYTEGLLAGDRGYSFSVEHRWPIPGLGILSPWLADRVQGATFFDFGRVWLDRSNPLFIDGQSNRSKRTLLAGAGVGVRARLTRYLQGFVDLGWGLVNRSGVEPNAQPSFRVHFGLRANLLPEDYRDWTATGQKKSNREKSSRKKPKDPKQLTLVPLKPRQ